MTREKKTQKNAEVEVGLRGKSLALRRRAVTMGAWYDIILFILYFTVRLTVITWY